MSSYLLRKLTKIFIFSSSSLRPRVINITYGMVNLPNQPSHLQYLLIEKSRASESRKIADNSLNSVPRELLQQLT